MDPPPAAPTFSATAAAMAAPTNSSYPDSVESSPRSRNTDSWDEQLLPAVGVGAKLRLMCSYGGHIVPRPHDKSLCYAGGDTRIVVADRHSTLSDLTNRLSRTLLNGRSFTLKYQLPNEDLDSLISVTTDEDLENMIEEYDRLTTAATATANNTTQKSSRLRLFLFPSKPDSGSSIGSLLENSTKSEDWFLNALNGATRGFSESASVNCLLGLDDDIAIAAGNANPSVKDVESQLESFVNVKGPSSHSNKQGAQDVHSMPDSPMLETMSSFGSTSSSPPLANLPPIRVHVEDQKAAVGGIEEQFSQMSVGAAVQKQDDGGFSVLSSPPTVLTTVAASAPAMAMALGSAGLPGEYSNRVFSDDERSEQGMSFGYRNPPQPQPQPLPLPSQLQSKPTGGVDLASSDSFSSDNSATNSLSRQRAMIYQDPVIQNHVYPVDPKLSDPNSRVQMQQVQDSAYILQAQFDQQHQQLDHQQQQQKQQLYQQHQQQQQQQQQLQQQQQQQQLQQQQQQQHQQQQQLQQQQQQQQQQFIQAGTHYIHHHPAAGAVPITSFYPMYPPQQQPLQPQHPLDQQYPVFYMPARQAQAYTLPVHQSNYSETAPTIPSSRPQTPPPAMIPPSAAYNTARNAPAPKPEMAAGMYRTSTAAAPPLIQVPSSQHQPQYVGYSQIHHPSQSIAPNSAATSNYAYEFADPAHAQAYYNQHMASQLAAQYQTMASAPAVMLPETSAQLPIDNVKQQIRTSQP